MNLDEPMTLVAESLPLDVGLKAPQMNFPLSSSQPGQNTINLLMGFDDFFNFGVNTDVGFYIDTTDRQPLQVHVNAVPVPGQSLSGTFGYFNISATPDVITSKSGNPTEFVGSFTIGLGDSASPSATYITYQDLIGGNLVIAPTLDATGEVDLSLKTSSFGISAVLDEQWDFSPSDPDLSGSQPQVSLNRIGTAWAQSVSDFLGPNLKRVFDSLDTGVVGDILDFIEKPLPIVSFFLGNTNTIDFLGLLSAVEGSPALYPVVVGFFDTIEFLRNLYRSVPTAFDPQYDLNIDQGSFTITQDLRTLNSLADIKTSSLIINNGGVTPFIDQIIAYEQNSQNKNFTTDEDGGIISGKLTGKLALGFQNASLTLPFFQDPNTVKLMLLGRPGDLVRLVTPSLGLTLQAQINFPVYSIGPLTLQIFAGNSSFRPSSSGSATTRPD